MTRYDGKTVTIWDEVIDTLMRYKLKGYIEMLEDKSYSGLLKKRTL